MEDVIFGGTAQRRQTGYAEVSLILDNTSHIFPMDESEVMVTRRYYRSGESEYYINRRSVRLKDVNELFMDTGLGREGYSIIGQGKIDEILSVKSADRREVFEEAAGISRYRHRKEEAERKLVHTDENLVRVNDKIAELELQVEPCGQSERARKFLVLRDELKGLEVSVWLDTLERLRASHIKLDADYQEAARQKEEARVALERLYAAAEALSAQMREKDVEADRLRFESQSREAAAAELESAIAVLKNNVQNNLDNAQRIRADLDQQEGRADSLAGQIGQRQGAAGRDRGQADSDAGGAAGQERAGPGGGPVCRDTGTGAGGTAAEGGHGDGHRRRGQGPALRPGGCRSGGAGPGRDGAPGAAGAGQPAGGGARRPASGPEGPGQGGGGAGRGAERHQRLRPAPGVTPEEGGAGPGAPYEAPDGRECPVIPGEDAHRDGEAPRGATPRRSSW